MPLFSETEMQAPDFLQSAWNRLKYGASCPKDGLLLPEDLSIERKIVLLEKLYQYALSQNATSAVLEKYADFRKWVGERRPDPTLDQWMWLYARIGEHHHRLPLAEVFGIMAGRDALLPFLESVPDQQIWNLFAPPVTKAEEPLPYPQLEEAVQEDAPAKVRLYQMICRNISADEIFARAFSLERPAIIAEALKTLSPDQRIQTLIEAHTTWKNPLPLFQKVLPQYSAEIASWRDAFGNGFFWYLYRRPVLHKELILSLPDEIEETFNVSNRYGITPAMLWRCNRPHPDVICRQR